MTDLSLDTKIMKIAQALEKARVPYAFGGAIALAYYAAPRGTEDIDINVFVKETQAGRCLKTLHHLGIVDSSTSRDSSHNQVILFWEHTSIHLFFSYDPFHESCKARARRVPFGDGEIWVLSAEDIAIFKTLYDRPKDCAEVREILLCMGEQMDVAYTLAWLERLLGTEDERVMSFSNSAMALVGTRPA